MVYSTGSRWTEEADAELRRLWSRGFSAAQIASEMRIKSRNSVIGRAHRLGLSGKGPKRHTYSTTNQPKRPPAKPKTGTFINSTTVAHAVEKRKFDVPVVEKARPDAPISLGIKLADLERHHCRWPIGQVGDPDFGFCGQNRAETSNYCEFHAMVSSGGLPRTQRTNDDRAQQPLLRSA